MSASGLPGGIGKKLIPERESHFFRWFSLEPTDEPEWHLHGDGRRTFRPSGPAFHALVRLDLLVSPDDEVMAAELHLDRRFVEDARNAPFARDIAKSFLSWAIDGAEATPLVANIADFRASPVPPLSRSRGPAPAKPAGAGYAVYLGNEPSATELINGMQVALANEEQPGKGVWLKIAVPAEMRG